MLGAQDKGRPKAPFTQLPVTCHRIWSGCLNTEADKQSHKPLAGTVELSVLNWGYTPALLITPEEYIEGEY